jgi:uncharacterized protein YecT (DUF1311 family)
VAAAVLLLAALPAHAQSRRPAPDPNRPHPAERAWVEACVLSAQAHPPRAAFGRCAWRIVAACMGETSESLLAARLPAMPDRPAPLRTCTLAETAIWQAQMDRWLREAALLGTSAAQEPLRRAQRAFLAWRDAACIAEGLLSAPEDEEQHRLACRLDQTALRALELKRQRDELWLAIGAASVEGN